MKAGDKIVEFCTNIKNRNTKIIDSAVRSEFENTYVGEMEIKDLAITLALLEKHNLLDKENCVNKEPLFYQTMYKKMKINGNGKTA